MLTFEDGYPRYSFIRDVNTTSINIIYIFTSILILQSCTVCLAERDYLRNYYFELNILLVLHVTFVQGSYITSSFDL